MTSIASLCLNEIKAVLNSSATLTDSEIDRQKLALDKALQLKLFNILIKKFDSACAASLTTWAFERIYYTEFKQRLEFVESLLIPKACDVAITSLPRVDERILRIQAGAGKELLNHTAILEAKIKADPYFFVKNLGIYDYLLDELLDPFCHKLRSEDLFKGFLYFEALDSKEIKSLYCLKYFDKESVEKSDEAELNITCIEKSICNVVTLFKLSGFDKFEGTDLSDLIVSESLLFSFDNVELPHHHEHLSLLTDLKSLLDSTFEILNEVFLSSFFESGSTQELKLVKCLAHFEALIAKIKESLPVVISVGLYNHAAYIVFYKDVMVICNKGFKKPGVDHLKFYKINIEKLTPMLFYNLYNLSFFSGIQKGAELQYLDFYLYKALPKALDGLSLASPLSVKRQNFGNCYYANLFSAMYVLGYLKLFMDKLVDHKTAQEVSKYMKRLYSYSVKSFALSTLKDDVESILTYTTTLSGKPFSLLKDVEYIYSKSILKLLDYRIRKVWIPSSSIELLPDIDGIVSASAGAAAGGGGGVGDEEFGGN